MLRLRRGGWGVFLGFDVLFFFFFLPLFFSVHSSHILVYATR